MSNKSIANPLLGLREQSSQSKSELFLNQEILDPSNQLKYLSHHFAEKIFSFLHFEVQ